jgi:hypothetical protein
VGLKLNGTHLVYAEVKILGNDIDTIKKIADTLADACREVGLEINVEN